MFQAPDVALSELVVGAVAYPVVLALNVIAHGFLTPGGGFQGGVVLAAAFVFVFSGVEYRSFDWLTLPLLTEPIEAVGAGAFVGLGSSFLENFLPLGTFGRLTSGGSAALVNWSAGLAVAGGFALIFAEYLQQGEAERYGRRRSPG